MIPPAPEWWNGLCAGVLVAAAAYVLFIGLPLLIMLSNAQDDPTDSPQPPEI